MSSERTILSIEAAPGDMPLGQEQPNGDLLVPSDARPLIAQALLQAEAALPSDHHAQLAALRKAKQLLGIETPQITPSWLPNLYKLWPI